MNVNRNDTINEKKKILHDAEEGPDWIRELNKIVNIEGICLKKNENSTYKQSQLSNSSPTKTR